MGIAASSRFTAAGIKRIAAARRAELLPDLDALRRVRHAAVEIQKADEARREAAACSWFASATRTVDLIVHGGSSERPASRVITTAYILGRFSGVYGISKAEIIGTGRQVRAVLLRQAVMYWTKRRAGRSLPEIGRRMGDKDHTTVLHAVRSYPEKRAKMGRYVLPLTSMSKEPA